MDVTRHEPTPARAWILAALTTPAVLIFISSNFVNVGNLAFNILFSRWMGPELFGDLALILTIKLSVLGVLGAVQMAVSQQVSTHDFQNNQCLPHLNRILFLGLLSGIPMALFAVFWIDIGTLIDFSSPLSFVLLFICIPFAAPLSILRGLAFGTQSTGRIVLTANVEMGVRLFGAILAWHLGFGLNGVVMAIGLSIIAGWLVLADMMPKQVPGSGQGPGQLKSLGISAFPFAVLQLSQVISLDGEIFLASAFLPAEDAGYVGALSLFQRIEFFACFALASVLLPSVVRAANCPRQIMIAAAPVLTIYFCVVFPFIVMVWFAPEMIISILVGQGFLIIASAMVPAAISAAAFTLSYLLATLLIA